MSTGGSLSNFGRASPVENLNVTHGVELDDGVGSGELRLGLTTMAVFGDEIELAIGLGVPTVGPSGLITYRAPPSASTPMAAAAATRVGMFIVENLRGMRKARRCWVRSI
jgi:hypothetical protein